MPDDFARACKEAARNLRRLPAELRREIGRETRETVAEPLAAEIRADWRGPRASALSAATRTKAGAEPTIAVTGRRPVLSGGASIVDIAYGEEFGGGKRVGQVRASRRARSYRRRTTQQFPTTGQHAIFGTVEARMEQTFDRWTEAVVRLTDKVLGDG